MTDKEQILFCLEQMRKWDETGEKPAEDTAAFVDQILERWAPLAEEMGMQKEQSELQNMSIKLQHPEDYKQLKQLLIDSEMMCENVFKTFALPIRAMLDALGIEYTFKYRMKSVYSIWRKMRVDHKEFDDVYDLFATRIVYKPLPAASFNELTELEQLPEVAAVKQQTMQQTDSEILTCWKIYSVISMLYRIHPDRIKDWITHPKKSGYQALQMTVMGPDCNWIEIQLRSERMNYDAEEGIAAHWKYKQETSVQ